MLPAATVHHPRAILPLCSFDQHDISSHHKRGAGVWRKTLKSESRNLMWAPFADCDSNAFPFEAFPPLINWPLFASSLEIARKLMCPSLVFRSGWFNSCTMSTGRRVRVFIYALIKHLKSRNSDLHRFRISERRVQFFHGTSKFK